MSMNLATYGLISALAIGGAGAVVQHQYSKPAGPNPPAARTDAVPPSSSDSTETSATVDCNKLMSDHEQMLQDIGRMDSQTDTLMSQMKDATSDSAKLAATMAVVESLVTQRKEMRDRMMAMEHETLQFLLTHKSTDPMGGCPQLTELLHQGAIVNGDNADTQDPSNTEKGGPNDMELGNER